MSARVGECELIQPVAAACFTPSGRQSVSERDWVSVSVGVSVCYASLYV